MEFMLDNARRLVPVPTVRLSARPTADAEIKFQISFVAGN